MTTNVRTSTASITSELVGPLVASLSCFLTLEMTIGAEVENPLLKVLLTFSPLILRSMKERTDLQGKGKGDFRVGCLHYVLRLDYLLWHGVSIR